MSRLVTRSIDAPERGELTWDERWKGNDQGLITCWEVGRKMRLSAPEVAARAQSGELPVLGWKGGVEKVIKKKSKIGTLFYLAQWQGLRGEDLEVNLDSEYELHCSRTRVKVLFTGNPAKYFKG